ncbi:hypothetical protein A2765_05900 [Candidatus Kaiserbacteria bacterium RIFCSPHIGHO2_01_FULL_56_24]|uniref:Uncharacterized protein n=1 Tax=Candidatus Kaiserbacteria bacterium RIFCSPHIGHO2_01_FULL_56_24 TaxID=1798487 RepID=A0A1F6D8E3_9BACT|nr:MAG: hypothetical protein A2765_05900 [Candidatus Kaiserbacteria bacterium RIFCSPHIGHO2_01_FULL_56_24]
MDKIPQPRLERTNDLEKERGRLSGALERFKTSIQTLFEKSDSTENIDPETQEIISQLQKGVNINALFTGLGAFTAGAVGAVALQDLWNMPESSYKPYVMAILGAAVLVKPLIWSVESRDHINNALAKLARKGVKA